MLERDVESKVVKYAKRHGCLVFKFSSPSQRGVPDRIFAKNGKVLFLEFKAPGKKPTKLQMHYINELHREGCSAGWCDNVEDGQSFIDSLLVEGMSCAFPGACDSPETCKGLDMCYHKTAT